MDAITALHTRSSVNLLDDPEPTPEQLDAILKAGLRASDHACLQPWEFLLIRGKSRHQFGELMVKTQQSILDQPIDHELRAKLLLKPLRAPLIVVVAAKTTDHPKVPPIEQVMSAAGAAQMMLVAAHALGVGGIWRSGPLMFEPVMKRGLGLSDKDQIAGFLYLGTAQINKPSPTLSLKGIVREWTNIESP